MKNAFHSETIFHKKVALSFVIPSEAEGSAVLRTLRGNVFLESAAQWRDLRFALASKAATAQLLQVSAPLHLAPKQADTCLIVRFHQQTQSGSHDRLLVSSARAAHGLSQQLIIDFDVGPHNVFYAKNLTFTGA